MSETPNDNSYGQTAVQLGYATEAQVQECVQIQARIREMGLDEPLGEIMLKKKYLNAQQHQTVLKRLGVHTSPIPGYTIQGKIGRGGMGTVYKANQTSVNRTVAVKVLAPAATRDETFVARFFQEARAAGRLSHKNLITAIDVGEANGLYYFVMEHVTGLSCRELLKTQGPFDEKKTLDIAVQMAEVLDYIHDHKLVHRDIKPDNILLTADGTVKLCDLGLAKSTASAEPSLTQPGFAVGTPYFMSPEQIRGEKDVDIRADLYSLGATLYFLATGKHPYEGQSAADTMSLHLNAPAPDPRKVSPQLSESFAQLVLKLMAKERGDRYQRPSDLRDDLKKIQAGVVPPRASQPAALPAPLHRPQITRRMVARESRPAGPVVAVAGGALVVAGVILVASFSHNPPAALPPGPSRAPELPVATAPKPLPEKPTEAVPPTVARPVEPKKATGDSPPSERDAALAKLDEEVRAACAKEEFQWALNLLAEARLRRPEPGLAPWIEKRSREVQEKAQKLYEELKQKALGARVFGVPDETRAIKERISRWGIPMFVADLDKSLAAVPARSSPAAVDASSEAQILQRQWEAAMRLAGARDYAGAAGELEQAAAGLHDEALRREAAADLEAVRLAEAFTGEALQALSKWPRGQRLAVEFLDDAGRRKRIDEPVLRADSFRVELRKEGGSVIVEFGEILAGSLADIVRNRPAKKTAKDARAATLLCLLEGDPEGARRRQGEPAPAIPEKYWIHAGRAAEGRAHPESREMEARNLYYSAEREFQDYATTAHAAQKFGTLLRDHAQTAFVKRNRLSILNRKEGGKEFFFSADDVRATGTFKPARTPRAESCWTSDADSDPARKKENVVEIVFSVLAETEYRCWVYVGGCCMETLTFYAEAADTAETGGPLAPVKQGIVTATRTHASHGGTKQPSRWGWVAIPLPRYSSAGPRRVRLFSDQKGFSVAYALVSSLKSVPPREAEIREIEKARAETPGGPSTSRGPLADPSLVGHWKFDEKSGLTAADSSRNRNHGTLLNGAVWAAGKFGGAVSLDGVDGHVRVPDSPALNTPTTQITIAAWAYSLSKKDGWRMLVSRQRGSGDQNLYYLGFDDNEYVFYVETTRGSRILTGPKSPINEWVHVAGTYDGADLRLFVNGSEVGSVSHAGTLPPEGGRLAIGADPDDPKDGVHEAFYGLIDDVRLYNRALSAAEVAALAGKGSK